VERQYKPHEAEGARDAMAKALYHKAFRCAWPKPCSSKWPAPDRCVNQNFPRWIVKRVNELLGPKRKTPAPTDKNIGILDIFGFECFDTNSFEQLLINLGSSIGPGPRCRRCCPVAAVQASYSECLGFHQPTSAYNSSSTTSSLRWR
jgi:hypothetical protein